MEEKQARNVTISLLRIISCLLIVWNHLSKHMLDGWGNPISWMNIGVQIFFFMSGYLYSKKDIYDIGTWIKKNFLKIFCPYWIYLIFILPIIAFLNLGEVTWFKVVAAFLGLQGFGFTIEGIGQHWFISYILICYLLTPIILNKLRKKIGGKWIIWLILVVFFVFGQLVTIPFALLFKFKVAYIFTYIVGYIYGVRFESRENENEKKVVDFIIILIALIGLIIRIYIDIFPFSGLWVSASDLLVQWSKLFGAAAIFIVIFQLFTNDKWNCVSENVKKIINRFSGYTYEIYLVHEFFTCDMFTQLFFISETWIKIVLVLVCIAINTILLVMLEKVVIRLKNLFM